jgi:hypothetical protein
MGQEAQGMVREGRGRPQGDAPGGGGGGRRSPVAAARQPVRAAASFPSQVRARFPPAQFRSTLLDTSAGGGGGGPSCGCDGGRSSSSSSRSGGGTAAKTAPRQLLGSQAAAAYPVHQRPPRRAAPPDAHPPVCETIYATDFGGGAPHGADALLPPAALQRERAAHRAASHWAALEAHEAGAAGAEAAARLREARITAAVRREALAAQVRLGSATSHASPRLRARPSPV